MSPVRDPASFVDEENWRGGYHQLAIEIGDRDDTRLSAALEVLCEERRLHGWFVDRSQEPFEQQPRPGDLHTLEEIGRLYGLADLPGGATTVCHTSVIRDLTLEVPDATSWPDWLSLSVPLGALARTDPRVGGYPFGSAPSLEWRDPIDRWLIELAIRIYERVPFRLGLVGCEVSGETTAAELTSIPDERSIAYLAPEGDDLLVYRSTI